MEEESHRRKTPAQLMALENFYSDEKYPLKTTIEDYAAGLGLTYKQVRGWFIERRRREKKEHGVIPLSIRGKKLPNCGRGKVGLGMMCQSIRDKVSLVHGGKIKSALFRQMQQLKSNAAQKERSKHKCTRKSRDYSVTENRIGKRKNMVQDTCIQDLLYTPDYILKKIFRKDGPPLGVEFDLLPSRAVGQLEDCSGSRHVSENERVLKRRKVPKPCSLDYNRNDGTGPENQRAVKRRKVLNTSMPECNKKSAAAKKHGIGKGLMIAWQATNHRDGTLPTGVDLDNIEITGSLPNSTVSRKSVPKKKLQQQIVMRERKLKEKMQNKRKTRAKRKEVVPNRKVDQSKPVRKMCELYLAGVIDREYLVRFATLVDDEELELREIQAGQNPLTCTSHFGGTGLNSCSLCKDMLTKFPPSFVKMKQPFSRQSWTSSPESIKKLFKVVPNRKVDQSKPVRKMCELYLAGVIDREYLVRFATLVDDEELELREIQAGQNPLTCTSHFGGTGLNSCSLCKDMLTKFPPSFVKMKQPFSRQSWTSSPESIKKLFKVFHFIYTYAESIDMRPFTLDEFAQALHDKNSLLLAEVHIALLRVLLSDVEDELDRDYPPRLSKSCKFLGLLRSIEHQKCVVGFWKRSLNPLTWTEILRQVLAASGPGSQSDGSKRGVLSKEAARMVKYGLSSGTLKGELFSLLSERGNNGMKVTELAKSYQIVELNLANTTIELENIIFSTLSSDITLFEKISSSAYRLRILPVTDEADYYDSDTQDSGSVDDSPEDNGTCSGNDDSECDSGISDLGKGRRTNHCKSRNALRVCMEIDESHPGEVWLLGLAEGEYSDLKVEEKLNALVALVDLLDAGLGSKKEDPTRAIIESIPNNYQYPSGGKIKRSSTVQQHFLGRATGQAEQSSKAGTASSDLGPIDSSTSNSSFNGMKKSDNNIKNVSQTEGAVCLHPMQSVYLGSDRRYNRYWLFLGPCTSSDPGHKRVYFESSEDGHWEVLDTEEDLHALLSVLDDRGKRESRLILSLEKRKNSLCHEMSSQMTDISEGKHPTISDQSELDREDGSSPTSNVDSNVCLTLTPKHSLAQPSAIAMEPGNNAEEQHRNRSRLQAFDAWIWQFFYLDFHSVKHGKSSYLDSLVRCECCHDLYWRDEKHCKICHATFELDFDLEDRYAIHEATCRVTEDSDPISKQKVLSSQLQSLKAAIYAIESFMPKDSLVGAWTKSAHKVWVKRLRRTSSLAELLQVLTDFVGAINEEWLRRCNLKLMTDNVVDEISTQFPKMPQTFSALALWLVKLDTVIAFYSNQDGSERPPEIDKTYKG